jgi:hypothetical protein
VQLRGKLGKMQAGDRHEPDQTHHDGNPVGSFAIGSEKFVAAMRVGWRLLGQAWQRHHGHRDGVMVDVTPAPRGLICRGLHGFHPLGFSSDAAAYPVSRMASAWMWRMTHVRRAVSGFRYEALEHRSNDS